jgi:anaerobic magnesium-protoporphyrin IX monomethyl ester cyclase
MNHGADIWMVRLEPAAAPQINHPLGYMQLASVLRRGGWWNLRIIDIPAAGLSWKTVLAAARRETPDVVFLTAYSVDMPNIRRFSAALAEASPTTCQLIGGPHPTGDPVGTLAALPAVRAAVIGEGDETVLELLEGLEPDDAAPLAAVRGVAWRGAGGAITTNPARPLMPALDDDLWPAYDLVDVPAYFRRSRMGVLYQHPQYMTLFTSRGCTHGCTFCHEVFGRVWRAHAPERVLDELEYLVRKHGIREVQFADDLFNGSRSRTLAICEGVVRRGLRVKICFPNGLRSDRLSEEEIEALHRAGTWRVCVSPETATQRLQAQVRKYTDLGRIREAIGHLVRRDILTSGFFMIGFPTETEAEMDATIRWALESELHTANFFRVIPFPGCRLRDEAARGGLDVEEIDQAYEGAGTSFNLSTIPDATIERRHREAMRAFYGDPRRLARLARVLPRHPGLWGAYLEEAAVRIGIGTNWPHLVGKLKGPDGGLGSLWSWLRTGDAHRGLRSP